MIPRDARLALTHTNGFPLEHQCFFQWLLYSPTKYSPIQRKKEYDCSWLLDDRLFFAALIREVFAFREIRVYSSVKSLDEHQIPLESWPSSFLAISKGKDKEDSLGRSFFDKIRNVFAHGAFNCIGSRLILYGTSSHEANSLVNLQMGLPLEIFRKGFSKLLEALDNYSNNPNQCKEELLNSFQWTKSVLGKASATKFVYIQNSKLATAETIDALSKDCLSRYGKVVFVYDESSVFLNRKSDWVPHEGFAMKDLLKIGNVFMEN